MRVKVIPAQQNTEGSGSGKDKKLRVAAYCRVSTELEEQESSYEAQVSHYTELISAKKDWILAGIYADEGISGTSTSGREDFLRLIADCEAHRIDMVITKSISRFARNTLDCLQYIRKLRALEIPVLFEKENINTMGMGGELLVTIMASLAQQESQSISQNVRMGIQYNFQKGKPMLNHKQFLGYTKERGGELKIVPEEADIVRQIFRDFLEGMSLGEIVFTLEEEGVKSPSGKSKWYHSTVISMLKNEKYMGDLLLQKSYTTDFLTKKKIRNNGLMPRYYVQNAHEPIVPREIFMMTQAKLAEIEHDRVVNGRSERTMKDLAINGKLKCSVCGVPYRRYATEESRAGSPVWRCRTRIANRHSCTGPAVTEKLVKDAVVTAFNRLPECREDLIRMQERIRWGPLETVRRKLRKLEAEKEELEEKMEVCAGDADQAYPQRNGWQQMDSGSGDMFTETADHDEILPETGKEPGENADGSQDTENVSLSEQLDDLRREINDLMGEKTDLVMQELQIQSALRLIDAITGRKKGRADMYIVTSTRQVIYLNDEPEPEKDSMQVCDGGGEAAGAEDGTESGGETAAPPASCTNVADFYRRTDHITQQGPLREYRNDYVKRFIDSVIMHDGYLMVMFKAGVGIRVRLNK